MIMLTETYVRRIKADIAILKAKGDLSLWLVKALQVTYLLLMSVLECKGTFSTGS